MKVEKNKKQLVRDPVCGMWIEPRDAADEILYKDKIYYFCAPGCKKEFESDPGKYLNTSFGKDNRNERSSS